MPILYRLARAGLFRLDPETAHEAVTRGLRGLPAPARALLRSYSSARDPILRTRVWGIDFESPIGLGAGFDKSATAFNALGALGFGFVEVGTITARPQEGNPKPRIFRLPADQALLNRMGFNNPGAEAVAQRLGNSPIQTVLGINVGKSRVTPLEDAAEDYLESIERLEPFASYLVINVSSPNTPGLRTLQDPGPLRHLLRSVRARRAAPEGRPPLLLKLAPDLEDRALDEAVDLALEEQVEGIIAVNTTTSRELRHTTTAEIDALGAGGISGAPLRDRAQAVVARIYGRTRGAIPIIGVGGISSAEDAWERVRAGANLLQLYTAFIYQGPGVIRRIEQGLGERLRAGGYACLDEAVGSAHR